MRSRIPFLAVRNTRHCRNIPHHTSIHIPSRSAISTSMSGELEKWKQTLVGKKYVEGGASAESDNTFSEATLPEKKRIVNPGMFLTMDFQKDRLNVHLDDNKVCTKVTMG
ncbi:hypothetical protein P168DRAFT_145622 [Aspergillus campestris IBT 28561]|uniref:Uncharacterized protein n=1 Tax=Aspergillus campestris (strain IBT 28561) TaxID=1392248 RepID=A0A2I1D5F9_ASPC2|nr:uncharacterized protein P168DRAFT_145622 [Aspergillus campestris IBT 28561]PKY05109.1 hypothetical protein P168DRAFT_145622 [Aspergillus campestris IBT 28561]